MKTKLNFQKIFHIAVLMLMLNTVSLFSQWEKTTLGWDYTLSGATNGSNIYVAGFIKGVYHSNDQGETWTLRGLNNITQIGAMTTSGKYVFAGTVQPAGKVYRSSDEGFTWTEVLNTNISNDYMWQMQSSGRNIYAAAINGIYVSRDFGNTWSLLSELPNAIGFAVNGSSLYVSSWDEPGLYISSDNGKSWTKTLDNKFVTSVAVRGESVFAGTEEDGMLYSTDNGSTWSQTSLQVPFILTTVIRGNVVYAANFDWNTFECGLYRSTDNGSTWSDYHDGFNFNDAFIVNILFSGDKVIAVTDWYSVWRRPFNGGQNNNAPFITESKQDKINNLPPGVIPKSRIDDIVNSKIAKDNEKFESKSSEDKNSIKLYSNYPNPFNPSTKISYELPVSGNVKLTIYNSIGQTVAELVNTVQNAGRHSVEWNASAMPSGMYFYRLEAGNFKETRKMMLVK